MEDRKSKLWWVQRFCGKSTLLQRVVWIPCDLYIKATRAFFTRFNLFNFSLKCMICVSVHLLCVCVLWEVRSQPRMSVSFPGSLRLGLSCHALTCTQDRMAWELVGDSPVSTCRLTVGLCTIAGFMWVLEIQSQVLRLAWQTLYPLSAPAPHMAFRRDYIGRLSVSQNTFPQLGGKKMKAFPKGVTAFPAAPSYFPMLWKDVWSEHKCKC